MHVHSMSFSTVLLLLGSSVAYGQVALDGTLGPKKTLAGPDYRISADLGQQVGGNLFHSFESFSLATGERALFTGPSSVKNIINRVTGGQQSYIDGRLESWISNADMYFFNPAGIVFGYNATLGIDGSFYASTADYLSLDGDGVFDARSGQTSVLTSASPHAFGFLTHQPESVSVLGSVFNVPELETISIIGGDLSIEAESYFGAPQGKLQLISVASAGEAVLNGFDIIEADFSDYGDIAITSAYLDISGNGGGHVFVRGGQLVMERSSIISQTNGPNTGLDIDIELTDGLIMDRSFVTSWTQGQGDAGNIKVNASNISLTNYANFNNSSLDSGQAGDIVINANNSVFLSADSGFFSDSLGEGSSGQITMTTPLLISEGGFISAIAYDTGDAGDITAHVDDLILKRTNGIRGQIITSTEGTGDGGDILIFARNKVNLQEGVIAANTSAEGNSGNIELSVSQLTMLGVDIGAEITSGTSGSGLGGKITITATDDISITESRITSGSAGSGSGNDLLIQTPNLSINGGYISSDAEAEGHAGNVTLVIDNELFLGIGPQGSRGRVSARAIDHGDGGDVQISAQHLTMAGGVVSTGTTSQGQAGNITLDVKQMALGLMNDVGSDITSATSGSGQGGQLNITATDSISVTASRISTTTAGTGPGENLYINTPKLTLMGGQISSDAESSGHAGNVILDIENDLNIYNANAQNRGLISAVSLAEGNAGDVSVSADAINIIGGFISTTTENVGAAGSIKLKGEHIRLSNTEDASASIASATYGSSPGGTIVIAADTLNLEGSEITAASNSQENDASASGHISITTRDTLNLFNGSQIDVSSRRASAGSIDIESDALIYLLNRGQISTSAAGGQGGGGNIELISPFIVLDDHSALVANASRDSGGHLDIEILDDGAFLLSQESFFKASTFNINASDTNTGGNLIIQSHEFFDANNLLYKKCSERAGEDKINLVSRQYQALPDSPYVLRSHLAFNGKERRKTRKSLQESLKTEFGLSSANLIKCHTNG